MIVFSTDIPATYVEPFLSKAGIPATEVELNTRGFLLLGCGLMIASTAAWASSSVTTTDEIESVCPTREALRDSTTWTFSALRSANDF